MIKPKIPLVVDLRIICVETLGICTAANTNYENYSVKISWLKRGYLVALSRFIVGQYELYYCRRKKFSLRR